MKRVRAYNSKGAKMTVTSDVAISENMVLVDAVDLLQRKKTWKYRILTCDPASIVSTGYYKEKLEECENKLDKLREAGYYIPLELEFLNPNILEK